MSIEKEILNRIRAIDWFSNSGNVINIQLDCDIKHVDSWKEAEKYYNQAIWEDKTLEAQNELTSYLFNKYRNEYSKWNNN